MTQNTLYTKYRGPPSDDIVYTNQSKRYACQQSAPGRVAGLPALHTCEHQAEAGAGGRVHCAATALSEAGVVTLRRSLRYPLSPPARDRRRLRTATRRSGVSSSQALCGRAQGGRTAKEQRGSQWGSRTHKDRLGAWRDTEDRRRPCGDHKRPRRDHVVRILSTGGRTVRREKSWCGYSRCREEVFVQTGKKHSSLALVDRRQNIRDPSISYHYVQVPQSQKVGDPPYRMSAIEEKARIWIVDHLARDAGNQLRSTAY